MKDKPNLDLLRTVAVSFVLFDHILLAKGIGKLGSWDVSQIGPFGVYIFFLHTSLVLMWSLERRPNTLDFYIRRIFRLYPLAILATLIVALGHVPIYFYLGRAAAVPGWTWRTLVLNCLLLEEGLPHTGILYGVTWSLPSEMYMYVLLPCLFFYAHAVRRIWPLVTMFALVCLVDYRIPGAPGNHFGVLIPDFLTGVIAYVGFMHRKAVLPWWTLLVLLAGLFVGYMAVHHWRADWMVCLLLSLLLPSIRQLKAPLVTGIVHSVAKYSYGIYLLHPLAIVVGIYLLHGRSVVQQVLGVLVTTGIGAFAAYHLVERPLIDLGAKIAARLAHERGLPSRKSLEDMEPAP